MNEPENTQTRTVVPSAPAADAITQMQVALNNLLDQVRETFLFLLEGAPPLSLKGTYVEEPEESLARCRDFRGEFERKWRSGQKDLKVPTAGAKQDKPDDDEDLTDEEVQNLMTAATSSEPFKPQLTSPDNVALAESDALFRAQRIAAIVQAIRGLADSLPSTMIRRGDEVEACTTPYKSNFLAEELEILERQNQAVTAALETHAAAVEKLAQRVNQSIVQLSKVIVREGQN